MTRTLVKVKQVEFLGNVISDVQAQLAARLLASALKKSSDTFLWTDDSVTATLKVIEAKIASMISAAAVGGASYQDGWSTAPESGIKKGWMYIYDSGTPPTGIELEAGDILIAKVDSPDKTLAANWSVVQGNLSAAVTSVSSIVTDGQLVVFSGTSGKVIKKYSAANGGFIFQTSAGVVITVLPTTETLTILGSVGAQTANLGFTPLPGSLKVFINGNLQTVGTDYTLTNNVITFLGWNTDSIDLSGSDYVVVAEYTMEV